MAELRRNQANFLSLFVLSPLTPKPMKIKIREATDDKEAYAPLLLRVVGSFMSQLSSTAYRHRRAQASD